MAMTMKRGALRMPELKVHVKIKNENIIVQTTHNNKMSISDSILIDADETWFTDPAVDHTIDLANGTIYDIVASPSGIGHRSI